ncbi:MAG: hypothetical protein EOO39_23210 [Cytophagaceae bacterium]|nr:MAG: hypothetical protein EOO39_23210 [Cytophagaceae bacterium]
MKALVIALCLSAGSLFAATPNEGPQAANLIVYRTGCLYGSMAKYRVNIDNQEQTKLKNKSIYTTTLTPGSHTIAPKNSNKAVTVNAQDGQTYVVQYKTRFGLFGARPKLKVMTLDEAKQNKKFVALQSNMGM